MQIQGENAPRVFKKGLRLFTGSPLACSMTTLLLCSHSHHLLSDVHKSNYFGNDEDGVGEVCAELGQVPRSTVSFDDSRNEKLNKSKLKAARAKAQGKRDHKSREEDDQEEAIRIKSPCRASPTARRRTIEQTSGPISRIIV